MPPETFNKINQRDRDSNSKENVHRNSWSEFIIHPSADQSADKCAGHPDGIEAGEPPRSITLLWDFVHVKQPDQTHHIVDAHVVAPGERCDTKRHYMHVAIERTAKF
jgi:hypothetical protein